MNYMREEDEEPEELDQIAKEGFGGVLCIETGGPTPGLGMCRTRDHSDISVIRRLAIV